MIGGKWTTFRSFGELAADLVLERPGRGRGQADTEDSRSAAARIFRPTSPAALVATVAPSGVPVAWGRVAATDGALRHRRGGDAAEICSGAGDQPWRAPAIRDRELDHLIRRRGGRALSCDLLPAPRPPSAITGGALARAPSMPRLRAWLGEPNGWDRASPTRERLRCSPCSPSSPNWHGLDRCYPASLASTGSLMRTTSKVRMNRLFGKGRCLDVAIDHGVCNEPSFLDGLEDMSTVRRGARRRRARRDPDELRPGRPAAGWCRARTSPRW